MMSREKNFQGHRLETIKHGGRTLAGVKGITAASGWEAGGQQAEKHLPQLLLLVRFLGSWSGARCHSNLSPQLPDPSLAGVGPSSSQSLSWASWGSTPSIQSPYLASFQARLCPSMAALRLALGMTERRTASQVLP